MARRSSRVLLPQPLGPTSATFSPVATVKAGTLRVKLPGPRRALASRSTR